MTIAPLTEFVPTGDGRTQLQRRWSPDRPLAAAVLVHGIGEHSGRYLHVGAKLADAGIDVLAFDNRGFGQSSGRRAYVANFDEFLDDVEELLEQRRALDVPVVLIGHSLGGLISAAYLESDRPGPDLAVLSAPALAAEVPTWQRLLAPVIGRVAPKLFIPSKIDGDLLSRDLAVQEAYINDPLGVAGSTAGLGKAVFEAMEATAAGIDRITVPTYVLHGALDRLVPPSASAPMARLPNVERRLWEGLRHECLNEPEQDEVLAELIAWLTLQLNPPIEGHSA